ncbi:IS110 family transposase, partial [Streptococcus hyovaginalis]
MNNTRNHRLNQVSTSTLIIGIDIAKNTHYACAVDDRGVELSTSFSIHQSHHGFHQFYLKLQNLKAIHQKDDLLIGFEPTGHYWMNLAAFLTQNDIRFVMVNPLHVNRSKELDDNLQTKNDKKDARVIAKLITNGYFSDPRQIEGIEAELREGSSIRWNLKKDISKVKNRIIRWTDRYFPEFKVAFKDLGLN